MEILVEEKEGYHTVTPVGELDIYTVPLFRKVILKVEGDLKKGVILDLSQMSFVDSSGIGALIETYQKITSKNGEIVFILDNPRIMKIFKLVKLDRVFKIFPNLGQALQSIGVSRGYIDEEFFSDIT